MKLDLEIDGDNGLHFEIDNGLILIIAILISAVCMVNFLHNHEKLELTPFEADFLLYALDAHVGVNIEGKSQTEKNGYKLEFIQQLRDKLFMHHDHPDEDL